MHAPGQAALQALATRLSLAAPGVAVLLALAALAGCASNDKAAWYIADPITTTERADRVRGGKINPETYAVKLHGADDPVVLFAFAADFTMDDSQDDARKEARNLLQSKLMALSEESVERHFNDVFQTQDTVNSALGLTAIGFTTAGAIVTNATSQIFSAIATGVLGAKSLVAEEIYADNLPEVMISRVRAEREVQAALIAKKQRLAIDQYSAAQAVDDALKYHSLGSFQTALALVVQDAQDVAKDKADEARENEEDQVDEMLDEDGESARDQQPLAQPD
ncbi:MAG: hypothetical protein AAFX79_10410 [Planctomycetota bacterium]